MSQDISASEENYKLYIQERESLVKAELSMAEKFDSAILTLGAGALAISLTFIQNIAPHPSEDTFWLLVLAWVLFSLSIISTLFSFLTSQHACRKQIEYIEQEILNNGCSKVNCIACVTRILNYASIFFFIFGVVALASFCYQNLPNDKQEVCMPDEKNKKKDRETAGYVPPKPPKVRRQSDIEDGVVTKEEPKTDSD